MKRTGILLFFILIPFFTCSPTPAARNVQDLEVLPHDKVLSEISEALHWNKIYLGQEGKEISSTEYLTAARRRLFEFYPDWSKEIKDYILCGQIAIGMNGLQVTAVLGFPEKQTKTVLIQMVLEYWTMWQGYELTFKNGILSVVTDQKSGAVLFSEDDER